MKIRNKTKTPSNIRRRTSTLDNVPSPRYSYHSQRSMSDTNTGRFTRDDYNEIPKIPKNKWWHHAPAIIAVIVVFVSIIYAVTLTTNPKIDIIGQPNQSIMQPISVYQNSAQKLLSSSIFNRTKLSINTDQIAVQLQKDFPELNGVSIIVPLLGHQPLLEIRPSQSIVILSNAQGQYVINQQGIAVLKLDNTLLNKYSLPVTTDNTGFQVKLGQQALSSTSVKFIKTIVDEFSAKGIAIQSMILTTNPYELDVQVRGVPYIIKFNLLSDPLYAVGTYLASIKLNLGPTQYIDVRIPGRAYYK